METLTYASHVDGTKPLLADLALPPTHEPAPLLAIVHGYSNDKSHVAMDVQELAEKGVVTLAMDMRGLGQSWGAWDSGGLDVHDLVDAIDAAVERYPHRIDTRRISLLGYSGGGGSVVAAALRFPDRFQQVVAFFPLLCQRRWLTDNTRPDVVERMTRILGSPADEPLLYDARDLIAAARNAPHTRFTFLYDTQETMCPPRFVDEWIAARRGQHVTVHTTAPGDRARWIHNYRQFNPALKEADALWLPRVFEPGRDLALPDHGEMIVPGYVVTRRFSVWLGESHAGRVEGLARIAYAGSNVTVIDNPANLPVTVQRAP